MAAEKFAFLLILLIFYTVKHVNCAHHQAAAPSPAVDCSSLILNMADCLSFVSAGSSVTKPEANCCSGLKIVLKADAECLCEAFKSSASLGVTMNITKALTLPTVCKVSAPSASNCNLSLSPVAAPGISPTDSSGSPTMTVGANEQAPSPAPGISSSSMNSISFGSLLIGLVVAYFSGF